MTQIEKERDRLTSGSQQVSLEEARRTLTERLIGALKQERSPKKLSKKRSTRVEKYQKGSRKKKSWMRVTSLGRIKKDEERYKLERQHAQLLEKVMEYGEKEEELRVLLKGEGGLYKGDGDLLGRIKKLEEDYKDSVFLPFAQQVEEVVKYLGIRVLETGKAEEDFLDYKGDVNFFLGDQKRLWRHRERGFETKWPYEVVYRGSTRKLEWENLIRRERIELERGRKEEGKEEARGEREEEKRMSLIELPMSRTEGEVKEEAKQEVEALMEQLRKQDRGEEEGGRGGREEKRKKEEMHREEVEKEIGEVLRRIRKEGGDREIGEEEEEQVRGLIYEAAGEGMCREIEGLFSDLNGWKRKEITMLGRTGEGLRGEIERALERYEGRKKKEGLFRRIKNRLMKGRKRRAREKAIEKEVEEAIWNWKVLSLRGQIEGFREGEEGIERLLKYRGGAKSRRKKEEKEEMGEECRGAYEELGVEAGASKEEIHKIYKKRAKESHPDRCRGEGEEEKENRGKEFQELSNAKEQIEKHLRGECGCKKRNRERAKEKEKEKERKKEEEQRRRREQGQERAGAGVGVGEIGVEKEEAEKWEEEFYREMRVKVFVMDNERCLEGDRELAEREKRHQEEVSRLKTEIEESKAKAERLERENEEQKEKTERLERENEEQKEKTERLERENEEQKEKTERLERENEKQRTETEDLRNEMAALKALVMSQFGQGKGQGKDEEEPESKPEFGEGVSSRQGPGMFG